MESLLKNSPRKKVDRQKAFNSTNGDEAEIYADSYMQLACSAQIITTSLKEEGHKIDRKLHANHPWIDEGLDVLIQVKSGKTYGKKELEGFTLKKRAIKETIREAYDICLLWVSNEGEVFWAYIHPRSLIKTTRLHLAHSVNPGTLYGLARCKMRFATKYSIGGSGITISTNETDFRAKRSKAKKAYKLLPKEGISSPLFGKILCTRYGWRHMFRKGRRLRAKDSSAAVIPYLEKILEQIPSTHRVLGTKQQIKGTRTYMSIIYLLTYEQILTGDQKDREKHHPVLVKIQEDISFPTDWVKRIGISKMTERRVTLLSVYHKKQPGLR